MRKYLLISLLLIASLCFGGERSPEWSKARHEYLYGNQVIDEIYLKETGIEQTQYHSERNEQGQPVCAVCLMPAKSIQVHHIVPFHINGKLELDSHNYITLCTSKYAGFNCHFAVGHGGNFKWENKHVVEDAMYLRVLIKKYKDARQYDTIPQEILDYLQEIHERVKRENNGV